MASDCVFACMNVLVFDLQDIISDCCLHGESCFLSSEGWASCAEGAVTVCVYYWCLILDRFQHEVGDEIHTFTKNEQKQWAYLCSGESTFYFRTKMCLACVSVWPIKKAILYPIVCMTEGLGRQNRETASGKKISIHKQFCTLYDSPSPFD